jgi:hypothetical protein
MVVVKVEEIYRRIGMKQSLWGNGRVDGKFGRMRNHFRSAGTCYTANNPQARSLRKGGRISKKTAQSSPSIKIVTAA